MNIKQALTFAVLMEKNGGILYKEPGYILEKLEAVDVDQPLALLDSKGNELVEQWQARHGVMWNKKGRRKGK